MGYVTRGEGVSVHRKDCKNVKDNKRLISVSWNEFTDKTYLTDLKIESLPNKNALLDIITKASLRNVYIETINNHDYDTYSIFELTVKIKRKEDLESFITDLEILPFIKEVTRISR